MSSKSRKPKPKAHPCNPPVCTRIIMRERCRQCAEHEEIARIIKRICGEPVDLSDLPPAILKASADQVAAIQAQTDELRAALKQVGDQLRPKRGE